MALKLRHLHEFMAAKPHAVLEYPFGEQPAVYKANNKMFALIDERKKPLRVSLKCDPTLAEVLRQRYESVMPGYHLNKRHWNTVVLSGQLSDEEVLDLINHSYNLVVAKEDT